MVEAVSDLLRRGYDPRVPNKGRPALRPDRRQARRRRRRARGWRDEVRDRPDAQDGSNIYAIADRNAGGKGIRVQLFAEFSRALLVQGIEGVDQQAAILLYLAEKTGRFLGQPADRGELLSWLFFLGTDLGPFWDRPFISSLPLPRASTTPSTGIAAKRSATIAYSTANSPAATTSSGPTTRWSTCPPGVGSIAPPV